jgi:hypothetical protein
LGEDKSRELLRIKPSWLDSSVNTTANSEMNSVNQMAPVNTAPMLETIRRTSTVLQKATVKYKSQIARESYCPAALKTDDEYDTKSMITDTPLQKLHNPAKPSAVTSIAYGRKELTPIAPT